MNEASAGESPVPGRRLGQREPDREPFGEEASERAPEAPPEDAEHASEHASEAASEAPSETARVAPSEAASVAPSEAARAGDRRGAAGWLRAWAPALLWSCVIFALSSIPGNQLPPLPGWWRADKLAHGVVHGVLGALCWHGLRATWARDRGAGLPIIAAAALTGLYGITDELHQAFTPGRTPDPFDVIADVVGGLLGALVGVAIVARRRAKAASARARV